MNPRPSLASLTLLIAACVDPAPYLPQGGESTQSDGPATTIDVLPPEAQDDVLCHDPSVGDTTELSAPGLLANDVAMGTLLVEAGEVATALGGSAVLTADGGLVYTPPSAGWGMDAFTYAVVDDSGGRAEATVQIDVRPNARVPFGIEDGFGGLVLAGEAIGDRAGTRVEGLGDVDGDGVPDIGVASHWANHAFQTAGRSYVVFAPPTASTVELSEVTNGPLGYALDGEAVRDIASWSMAGGGDFNGDGTPDLLVGAPWADTNPCPGAPPFEEGCAQGRGYVVWGHAEPISASLAAVSSGTAGQAFDGPDPVAVVGMWLDSVPDLDGDGLDEILLGAPQFDETFGRVYLIRGDVFAGTRVLDSVGTAIDGFVMQGNGHVGRFVSSVGDVNGDGMADLAMAAPDVASMAGIVHIVFGKLDDDPVDLEMLETTGQGFTITSASVNAQLGSSLSALGDVDGDGLDDLILGAPGPGDWDYAANGLAEALPGRAYVVYGKADGAPIALADVERGIGGFIIAGEAASAAGYSVAGLGDFNGDGISDLAIGAPAIDNSAGRAYVVFGGATGSRVELSEVAQGRGGLMLAGVEPYEHFGYAVGDPGDIDGDGLADVLVGAPGHASGAPNSALGRGRVYAMFGVPLPTEGASCDPTVVSPAAGR